MNGRMFYTLISGFGCGIFLTSFFPLGFSIFLLAIVISMVGLFLSGRGILSKRKEIFLCAMFILSFGSGVLRFSVDNINQNRLRNALISKLGEKVKVIGIVQSEPTSSGISQRAVASVVFEDCNTSQNILVQTEINPKLDYGDQIEIVGKIERPVAPPTDETGRQFDYEAYLANENIFYQISFAQVKIVDKNRGSTWRTFLYSLKSDFMNNIKKVIGEPEVSYLGGLLFGDKTSLPPEWKNIFAKAGITHIVALSGYNITIVAEWLGKILSLFLPLVGSLLLSGFGIICFVLMTGASATAVRAGVMALIVLFGRAIGRQYDIKRGLFLAGLIMLIFEPRLLVFDISFQLSFLATLSLIYVSPLLEKHFGWLTPKLKLRELFVATVSAQILVLPLILYKLGWLSFVSVLANLMILPLVPATMLFGFLTGLFGYLSQLISLLPGSVTDILLIIQLSLARFFANLPFSAVSLNVFSYWWSISLELKFPFQRDCQGIEAKNELRYWNPDCHLIVRPYQRLRSLDLLYSKASVDNF